MDLETLKKLENLSSEQERQFRLYSEFLISENEKYNITAITDERDIVSYHFEDSLAIRRFIDFSALKMIGDIGSGGGFPGIPLKIVFPHLSLVLIEVNGKKVNFLRQLVDKLGLENVTVCQIDWRTFLRQTDYPVELFCARASLQLSELVRMFRPSSPYKNAKLAYWASSNWVEGSAEKEFLLEKKSYGLGDGERERQCVVFGKNQ